MRFAERLIAPALDGLLLAGSLWLLPPLRTLFTVPHWSGALLVLAAYCAMCAGMWLLKLIEHPAAAGQSTPPPALEKNDNAYSCLGFLSFCFSIFVLTMLLLSLSIGESGPAGEAWESLPERHPWLFSIGAVLVLVLVCIFPGVALSRPAPHLANGSALALLARLLGVLSVNAMVLISGAWWQATLGSSEPLDASLGLRLLLFVIFYVVLLMFYAPPRLALLAIDGDRLSLLSFLIVLGFIVWPLTR